MSGLEVAGLILALFPVLVEGVKTVVAGASQIKKLKQWRFQLEGLRGDLNTQKTLFLNMVELLLQDIVDANAVAGVLEDLHSSWKDHPYEKDLRHRLGNSYETFCHLLEDLSNELRELERKPLFRGELEQSLGKGNNINSVLSQHVYEEQISRIRRINSELRDLVFLNRKLQKRKGGGLSSPAFERVCSLYSTARRQACTVYETFVQGTIWKCPPECQHYASTELDLSPGLLTSEEAPAGWQNPSFIIHLSVGRTTSAALANESPCHTWRKILIEMVEDDQHDVPMPSTTSLQPRTNDTKNTMVGTDRVRIPRRFKPKRAVHHPSHAAQDIALKDAVAAIDHNQPSDAVDLCKVLNNQCQRTQAPNGNASQPLTFPISRGIQERCIALLTVQSPSTSGLRPLSDILQSTTPPHFRTGHRLYIAAILASTTVRYAGSWLSESWGAQEIYFRIQDLAYRDLDRDLTPSPYLSWQTKRSLTVARAAALPISTGADFQHIVRNRPLFQLGLALIELSLGRTMTSLRLPTDRDSAGELHTLSKSAWRLLRSVYLESGRGYGDIVWKCLSCPFNYTDPKLDDEDFQRDVIKDVVEPLSKLWKVFHDPNLPGF